MASACDACGRQEYMPYACKFCHKRFCAEHRLPESHACAGLEEYRQRVRQEGRLMGPEPGEPMRPQVSSGAAWRASLDRAFAGVEGKMAWVFLGTMLAVFVIQLLLEISGRHTLGRTLFVMDRTFYLHPWVVVTSIFAHGGFGHILFNALTLAFCGPAVESLLGTRRFTLLFLGAGAMGGLGEILLGAALGGPAVGVLGASGAIMGLLGTLVVLVPRMPIAFMGFIPAPLWVLIVLYAIFDLYGAFGRGTGVAHLAHLSGLAVGLAYGKSLRDRGMRAQVRPAMPPRRW